MTYPQIHKRICEQGYDGTVASLRMFVQKEQIRINEANKSAYSSDYLPKEYVQRKSLTQLLYKKIDDIHTITGEQYEQVLKEYPKLATLYKIMQEFYGVMRSNHPERLDLVHDMETLDIPELNTFCNGIKNDIVAVKNAISTKYNNGLAEGSVNKIKVIKRVMYGRNSFELLKAKVLFYEQFRSLTN